MGNTDKYTVDKFVDHLRDNGHPGLKINSYPDAHNRTTPDIDAIAGPFVIEHTSIDTIQSQREKDDWFTKVTNGLEKELAGQISYCLKVRLEYSAVTKGQDWNLIRDSLKRWIINNTPSLKWGSQKLVGVPGIPFSLHVDKDINSPPGLFFMRSEPLNSTLPQRIKNQCAGKAMKLAKYKGCGKTTVLLIESVDIALMSEPKMLDAIRKAFSNNLPLGVDRIWYAAKFDSGFAFKDFTQKI